MADDKDQKTESATPKKRDEERKKGNVAKSREIPSAIILLVSLATLYVAGSYMFENMMKVVDRGLAGAGTMEFTKERIHLLLVDSIVDIGMITFPILLAIFLVAIVSNVAQTGLMISSEAMEPKFEKIDPIKGLGRIFSLKSIVELIKSVAKITIVAYVVYTAIAAEVEKVPPLMFMSTWEVVVFIGELSFTILLKSSWVLLILAIIDYSYQKWEYEKNIRMTKQEVKDESKQSDGDPQVKARIKTLQREWARQRMMEAVPNADVVITNPTHFAVALKYDKGEMGAPIVVAMGRNHLAQRIKAVAREAGVPLVEDKPLAQALYKATDIGMEVPTNLYKAVAEVLAYIYKLNGKKSNQGMHSEGR